MRKTTIPWFLWCAVAAVTVCLIGVHWDISWHRSIGRDTFWTPAHVAIYLCGVLAGVSSGYLILTTTFGRSVERKGRSVKMWTFRGPLGAFVMAWGGLAMLTSAPFDDWWHNAYGLDVKIISPPHIVLALGIYAIQLGTLLLVLGFRNRAEGEMRARYDRLLIVLGGLAVVNAMTLIMESSGRTLMHSALYYRNICFALPLALTSISRASERRWATTEIAAVFTLFWNGMNWILPLFPAEPKLGPVYYPVTHMTPSVFPALIIVPAFLLDLLWPRVAAWPNAVKAAAAGGVLLAGLLAVQWPFANFLMSPWARNWIFYADSFDYLARPQSYQMRHLFFPLERTQGEFWSRMGVALGASVLLTYIGIYWSRFLVRVKR